MNIIGTLGKDVSIKMIRIAICDDEEYYRDQIRQIVSEYMTANIMEEYRIQIYTSGNEVICDMENLKNFQILFMDISMSDTDGITAAKEVRRVNEGIFIAFITSFIDYSLEGYKVNAIRYLLKDSLELALPECLDAIFSKMKREMRTLKIPVNGGTVSLPVNRILYIESQKHKLILHVQTEGKEQKQYTAVKKLDEMEKELPSEVFIRIHKSYLIHAGFISRINNYKIFLCNGETYNISRNRYRIAKEKYINYKGNE